MALNPPETVWIVHGSLRRSRANGPGERFVLWVQGCTLGCHGCFNPGTHSAMGTPVSVDSVLTQVLQLPDLEGVTLTGGEPLQQPEALEEFCRGLKKRSDLGVIVLTGYSVEEIRADERLMAASQDVDVLVAGRYNSRLHLGAGLRGSSNKSYWFLTDRYSGEEFEAIPEIEVLVDSQGTLTVTGMVPWSLPV